MSAVRGKGPEELYIEFCVLEKEVIAWEQTATAIQL